MIDEIKRLPNPYLPITHNIEGREFVGRDKEIDILVRILDQSAKTGKVSNILISGDKSLGKSTLLHKYQGILESHGIAVYQTELSRDQNQRLDEFEFFKELIGDLFVRFGPPEGSFFSPEQLEMWVNLTSNDYASNMNPLDRQLQFPTQYSSRKRGRSENLAYKALEADFSVILDQLQTSVGFKGLAIVIDEVQELCRNSFILDSLRRLSESLNQFMIIGAGLPTFLNNSLFEKFLRTSHPITLRSFGRRAALDLITKPLENRAKISKHDALHLFHPGTLHQLVSRTGGNPLHTRILCSRLFEDFSASKDAQSMKLSRKVMDQVMEYYCNTSDQSARIRTSLESCTSDQLEAFRRLYRYSGFNLKSSVLIQTAFLSIQEESTKPVIERLVADLEALFDLGLFTLSGADSVSDISSLSLDQLSKVVLDFSGDVIDKLYTQYYYEDLTGEELIEPISANFDDELANKLANDMSDAVIREGLLAEPVEERGLIRVSSKESDTNQAPEIMLSELDKLACIDQKDLSEEKTRDLVTQISQKYHLEFPARFNTLLEYGGYFLLISKVLVRGKPFIIFNYIPVKPTDTGGIKLIRKLDEIERLINASLSDYSISVEWTYVYSLQRSVLLLVVAVDLSDQMEKLYQLVQDRKYDEAASLADSIMRTDARIKDGALYTSSARFNDYGFCLVNIGNTERAEALFTDLFDKLLISQVNKAYVHFANNELGKCKDILKKIERKRLGNAELAMYLHLCISSPALSHGDRIVSQVLISDVIHWNLALISAYEHDDQSIYNRYLKGVSSTGKSSPVHKRVLYWISFYKAEREKSIASAEALLELLGDFNYLSPSIRKDITALRAA